MMVWTQESIHDIVEKQRSYFRSNITLDVKWRKQQLKKLYNGILKHRSELEEALREDLGRSDTEAFLLDIGMVLMEIKECINHLRRWQKPETHFSGLVAFPSLITKVYKMPYGVSLIIAPFNFPVLLSLGVLAAAISGGNTAVIKLSSKSSKSTEAIISLLADVFQKEYVIGIDGGHDVADFCLAERFDKIFYTGSPNVGKHVMSEASKNLTPVALELGGETGNWAVVRKDANIKDAARKIAFFKICNSGQVCININQVAVAKEVAEQFIDEMKKAIIEQIGDNPVENDEYPKLISNKAYEWCVEEAEEYRKRIVFGGNGNPASLKYSPTLIYPVDINEKICNHELFCPLLPIVPFEDNKIDDLMDIIASREHGLSLYLFTKNIKWAKSTMQKQQYGSGCINEVTMQLTVKGVPFGGTGHSGMGAYHGIWGFREFTHPSTVLFGKTYFNISQKLRSHPYIKNGKKTKKKIFTKLMK